MNFFPHINARNSCKSAKYSVNRSNIVAILHQNTIRILAAVKKQENNRVA